MKLFTQINVFQKLYLPFHVVFHDIRYRSFVMGCPKGGIRVSVEVGLQKGRDEIRRGNDTLLYSMINLAEKKN